MKTLFTLSLVIIALSASAQSEGPSRSVLPTQVVQKDTIPGYVLFADSKRKKDFVRYVKGYQVFAKTGPVYLAYNKQRLNSNAVVLQFIPDYQTVKQ